MQIDGMLKEGLSLREISRRTGVPYSTLRGRVIQSGLHQPYHKKAAKGTACCLRCREELALSKFSDSCLRYGRYICKVCNSKENHTRQIEKLGCSRKLYEELFLRQNSKCAICNKSAGHKIKSGFARLAVDHDHQTGEIRGLLCNKCNRGLGYLDGYLESALEYVRGVSR